LSPELLTRPTRSPVATEDLSRAETEALIEEARQRQRRRRLGLAAVVVAAAAVAAVVYGGVVRSDRSNAPMSSTGSLVSGTVLRLHLAGFGTPLPTEVDKGPCPQGRTEIRIRSGAGALIGSQSGCALSIGKTDAPNGGLVRITQTARETYVLPGGTIVSLETQTIRFAADQRHTVATFHGRVLRGTGRYAHARGTVSGGGRGFDGKADWLMNIHFD
jgi:ferric-dicitrate binding protein FerR (iron transport regulator)